MGMFDNLKVQAPLPDPEYQERTFQTKSLECCLFEYTITAEGRLVLREVELEEIPEEEQPYYAPESEEADIVRMFGATRLKSSRDVVQDDFHGDIIFYDTVNAPNDALFAIDFKEGVSGYVEADGTIKPLDPITVYYKARFTDGWLQWIRRISQEQADRESARERG